MTKEKAKNKTESGTAGTKKAAKKKTDKPTVKTSAKTKKKTDKKASSGESVSKFAVIQTGGKQYLVTEGQTLKIEKIRGGKEGETATFDEVLLVVDGKDIKIGTPFVNGAKVTAKIEGDERDKKITVIRYKSKTRQFKKKGHRQTHTKITITEIK